MKTECFPAVLCAAALAAALAAAPAAAADKFMADRHADRKVACNSCHVKGMDPPAAGDCLKCHGGSYAALIKKTEDSDFNFHETHLGEPDCSECHSCHRKPKLVCDSCHEGDFADTHVP